jgi:hypothetical protein
MIKSQKIDKLFCKNMQFLCKRLRFCVEIKQEILGRTNSLPSFDTTWTAWKTTGPTIVVFVAAETLFYRAVAQKR